MSFSKNTVKGILFTLGIIASFLSVYVGFKNAMTYSVDFQWSPAVAFWSGIDPYSAALSLDRNKYIILTQDPNYLHGLYLLFFPLAKLNFEQAKLTWVILNILFGFGCLYLVNKIYNLSVKELIITGIIFLCSAPFRNCLGNGQQTLMILFFLLLYWHHKNESRGISLFIVGLKYSFAPIFFLRSMLKKEKAFFIALALIIISALLFSFKVNQKLNIHLLISPLLVAQSKTSLGFSDIYSFIKAYTNFPFYISLSIPLCMTVLLIYWDLKFDNPYKLSILCLFSLLLFYHLIYDYIFMLPLIAQALKRKKSQSIFLNTAIFFCLTYFMFIHTIIFRFKLHDSDLLKWIGFLLMAGTSLSLIFTYSRKKSINELNESE